MQRSQSVGGNVQRPSWALESFLMNCRGTLLSLRCEDKIPRKIFNPEPSGVLGKAWRPRSTSFGLPYGGVGAGRWEIQSDN